MYSKTSSENIFYPVRYTSFEWSERLSWGIRWKQVHLWPEAVSKSKFLSCIWLLYDGVMLSSRTCGSHFLLITNVSTITSHSSVFALSHPPTPILLDKKHPYNVDLSLALTGQALIPLMHWAFEPCMHADTQHPRSPLLIPRCRRARPSHQITCCYVQPQQQRSIAICWGHTCRGLNEWLAFWWLLVPPVPPRPPPPPR